MKGFGTNEAELIRALSKLDPLQVATVRQAYQQRFMRNLAQDIEKETSGYFEEGLLAIVRGPLEQDCFLVHSAIKGLGTKESMLDDVLIGRSNADINAIKAQYQQMYHKSLESDVRGDLSAETERMYMMIISARRNEDSAPTIPQEIDRDADTLHRAMAGMGKDHAAVCSIITGRNDGQLRAIAHAYQQKYKRPIAKVIESNFSFHMESALLLALARGCDRIKSDADQLEDAMAGMGTKDQLLVNRVVRAHWNRGHMQQVRNAYKQFHKRDLVSRIKGETRGDYEKLMVACVE